MIAPVREIVTAMKQNDLQERCQKAQFAVSKKRTHFGIHTDDIQKIFINLSTMAGGLNADELASLKSSMQDVENAIAYSSSLPVFKASLQRLVDGALAVLNERSLKEQSMRLTAPEKAARSAFRAAVLVPIPLQEIGKFQANNQLKK